MSEQKHTPGPWEVINGTDIFGPLGGDSGDGAAADSNDGWQVAEVGYYKTFYNGELTELGEDCRKANARLIAAAPDLLEACKLHIETLSKQKRNGEPLDSESLNRAQKMMIKAIARAEGKQQ